MELSTKRKCLSIGGMACAACQNKIEKKLRNTAGIRSAHVSFSKGTADILYDTDIINLQEITSLIVKLGYEVPSETENPKSAIFRAAGFLLCIAALYMLLQHFGILNLLAPAQLGDAQMGYGMLFVIGLLTSVHCIAMCGGINLSQCMPKCNEVMEAENRLTLFAPALLYNCGRVIAYTLTGTVLGFAGMVLGGGANTGLSATTRGILKLIAGFCMVMMGLNMLSLFPWLRRLQPRMPNAFLRMVGEGKAKSGAPLLVGLLNGLMPCGPLQSMQIVALASGNPLAGGLSMLLFSLGTVPLMLGLGSMVSALGKRFSKNVMAIGSVLVVVLGLSMLTQGVRLSGIVLPGASMDVATADLVPKAPMKKGDASEIVGGKQVVNSTLSPRKYPNITVQAGMPVKWVIDAPKGSINGCNNRILIGDYGIEYTFQQGENIIEFTPEKAGTVRYSCWMGMISGAITVEEAPA